MKTNVETHCKMRKNPIEFIKGTPFQTTRVDYWNPKGLPFANTKKHSKAQWGDGLATIKSDVDQLRKIHCKSNGIQHNPRPPLTTSKHID